MKRQIKTFKDLEDFVNGKKKLKRKRSRPSKTMGEMKGWAAFEKTYWELFHRRYEPIAGTPFFVKRKPTQP